MRRYESLIPLPLLVLLWAHLVWAGPAGPILPVVQVSAVDSTTGKIASLVLCDDGSLETIWADEGVRCKTVSRDEVVTIRRLLSSADFERAFARAEERAAKQRSVSKDPLLKIVISGRVGVEPSRSAAGPIKKLVSSLNGLYKKSCTGSSVPQIDLEK